MTTNPKRPRQSFKSTQCRELRLLRYFPGEESFRRNVLQGIYWGKGKTVRKVFWERNCSNLVWYSLLAERNLLISSGLVLSLRTSTLSFATPTSNQGDQSKLGGPEKSLFECSPGVRREEWLPIVVVIQLKRQVPLSFNFCVIVYICGWTNNEWLYVRL